MMIREIANLNTGYQRERREERERNERVSLSLEVAVNEARVHR